MVGNERQGWAIFATMGVLFLAGVVVCYWAEAAGNPLVHALGIEGRNMEGKEVRFGIPLSALFAVITTAASCGAVNAMHGSFTALGGLIPLINMELGEVIVGGVGAGFYGILLFVVIAIFVAGLMVGRTPEYLGKKIEAKEVKMAVLAILCLPTSMLVFTAIAVVLPTGVASIGTPGPHGFSEILYAYTSGAANNGSAFGGLTGNTPWYNITIGIAMLMGRFLVIIPALAIAGSLVAKKTCSGLGGHLPDRRHAVCRPAGRRHPDRRRPDLLPGPRASGRSSNISRRPPGRPSDGRVMSCPFTRFADTSTPAPHSRREGSRADARLRHHPRPDAGVALVVGCSPTHSPIFSRPDRSRCSQNHKLESPMSQSKSASIMDARILVPAIGGAFKKLNPRSLAKNPVIFVVAVVSVLTTVLFVRDLVDWRRQSRLLLPDQSLALVHRALRQLRGSGGRGARQGAGRLRCAAREPRPRRSCSAARTAPSSSSCPAPA